MFFFKFFDGIRWFLILTWDLEKKRRKVIVHHTPTGGSTVVVAISVPLPYGLRPYGVERPPLSWLCHGLIRAGSHCLCYKVPNLVSASAPARYVKWRLLACQHATTKSSSSFASTVRLLPQPTAASSATAAVASQHFPTFIYSVSFTIN